MRKKEKGEEKLKVRQERSILVVDSPRNSSYKANWGCKTEKEKVERDLARKSTSWTCSPSDQNVSPHRG
uniref:Uncharacterized protein n=1 Tax=Solanum tuberosum TaxID=4113 RepID=M1DDX1_SOLTU